MTDNDPRDGDYALIADAIIAAFNPHDDDVAEEAILIRAIERARDVIAALPCTCAPEILDAWGDPTCPRCGALGQVRKVVVW
jgi:hypothetical protein